MRKSFTYFFLLTSFVLQAQLKSFGTQAKHKPGPSYKYSLYGYYDIVRERGVGFQIQKGNRWNFDLSVYNVYDNDKMFGGVQYNYADFNGYGASIKPKYSVGNMGRLYVGANIGFEYLEHPTIRVNRSEHGNHYDFITYESCKGNVLNIGATVGYKLQIKNLFIEPFGSIGLVHNYTTSTLYSANGLGLYLPKNTTFPTEKKFRTMYAHLNIGVKMGISFKDYSQKREAINQLVDSDYIPRLQKLEKIFNDLGKDSIKRYSELKSAKGHYKKLNLSFKRTYKKYYNKPDFFNSKIKGHFIFIEQKINEHYEFSRNLKNKYIPTTIELLNKLDLLSQNKALRNRYLYYAEEKCFKLYERLLDYSNPQSKSKISLQEYNNRKKQIDELIFKAQLN